MSGYKSTLKVSLQNTPVKIDDTFYGRFTQSEALSSDAIYDLTTAPLQIVFGQISNTNYKQLLIENPSEEIVQYGKDDGDGFEELGRVSPNMTSLGEPPPGVDLQFKTVSGTAKVRIIVIGQ